MELQEQFDVQQLADLFGVTRPSLARVFGEMQKDGLKVENQTKLDVYYDNHLLPLDYRLDILVEDKVIIELKSVDEVTPVHFKQLLTYLKLANKRLGILVNFNADNISKAIYRKVNNL